MKISPELAARHRGKIVLVMDQESADFYIEDILQPYADRTNDVGVKDDLKYLREQYERAWPEDEDEDGSAWWY